MHYIVRTSEASRLFRDIRESERFLFSQVSWKCHSWQWLRMFTVWIWFCLCEILERAQKTCNRPFGQVRVVRFYQSCSSPPSSSSFSSSASSSSSTTSASTSTSTVALPTLGQALRQLRGSVRTAGPQPGTFPAQCAPLDLNLGPSQLSAHRWTSTWDLPSSVCTAGPQPGTFRAQCAPLDLNLGPSELSAHRWTSTAR